MITFDEKPKVMPGRLPVTVENNHHYNLKYDCFDIEFDRRIDHQIRNKFIWNVRESYYYDSASFLLKIIELGIP